MQRAFLTERIIDANRVLLDLSTLSVNPIQPENRIAFQVICDCLAIYADLLRCQIEMPYAANEFPGLQSLVERLKANLSLLGQEV